MVDFVNVESYLRNASPKGIINMHQILNPKWKISVIVPVFECGDREVVINYSPISKLCIFGKVLEKVLFNRFFSSVKHQIIQDQYRFYHKESLKTNSMCFSRFVIRTIDDRG